MDVVPAVFAEVLNTVLTPKLVRFCAALFAQRFSIVGTKS